MPTKPDSDPDPEAQATSPAGFEPLIEVENLQVRSTPRGGLLGRVAGRTPAVDGVDLTLCRGETLGLLGGPGSGRTALARTLTALAKTTGGTVRLGVEEISGYGERKLRRLRPRLRTVFLDPQDAPDPAADLRTVVGRPLRLHKLVQDETEYDARVARALERTGLTPAAQHLARPLAELTGAERQRALIARAIVTGPELLVIGEPGPDGRDDVLRLLQDLRPELELTYVLLTDDPDVIRSFCDTVAVMYRGRVVEHGPAAQILGAPLHPYTRALFADKDRDGQTPPTGQARTAPGCSYRPRCPVALAGCGWDPDDLRDLLERRRAGLPQEERALEKAAVGAIESRGEPDRPAAAVHPGKGRTAGDALEYLRRLREEASAAEPREPFWRGVVTMHEDDGRAVVEFERPQVPRLTLLPDSGVRVACHLYAGSAGDVPNPGKSKGDRRG